MGYIKKYNDFNLISEGLKYHIDNNLSLTESIYRLGSDSWISLMSECKTLYKNGKDFGDDNFLLETDIGEVSIFNSESVLLDVPFIDDEYINESEYNGREVKLNKPFRSTGPKKYAVYVKNPKTGNVVKVNFGDVKGGLTAKINDPKARKSFAARHKCDTRTDKTKPSYWSCRLPRYGKLLGLSKNMNTWW